MDLNKNAESTLKEKGKIIVIEGMDKAGKTTQSKILYDHFNKIFDKKVELLSFPDYSTRIGMEIKSFLSGEIEYNNEVKHLLLSANRWEKKSHIEKLKDQNKIIIINRYYQSNLVYGSVNGLDIDWLLNLDKGLPKEDLTIILDINPSITHKRSIENNFVLDEFEKNMDFLYRVRNKYLELAKKFNWPVIDSNTSISNVSNAIIKIINHIN